jgi:lipopolysaccharide assembly outer membrane protein LptD (OstA)
MKMIPNDRIIAKPMILYIQELPIFYLPFAVFPNKNGDRISGWIMPSFGHKSSTGTYLDNLGYYHVIDDYSDYTFLFDIQDKRGVIINHEYRYKRKSGNHWYNYYLDGYIDYENKYYLSYEDTNISNLFNDNSSKIKNISWKHQQSFDPTQHLIINYKYKSIFDPKEINLNNRLDQNQLTSLSYQKRWSRNSLSIGFEEYEDLFIPNPNTIDDINIYKWFTGPRINFSLPQRKMIGNGDKWYNNLYLSYNFSYDHGKETFTKTAGEDLQNSDNLIWNNETEDRKKGAAKNLLQFTMASKVGWITLSPRLNIYEDWAFQYRNKNSESSNYEYKSGFNRRLTWNSSLTANTKIYGIIPVNLGNLISLRHKLSPQMTLNYTPSLKNNFKDQIDEYGEDILGGSYVNSIPQEESKRITFSLNSTFQAKLNNEDNTINKRDFLDINMTVDYNNQIEDEKFSLIDSKWSFKKANGGELFFVHMQHDMYDEINKNLLLKKGKLPELEYLRFQMSSNYRLNGTTINSMNNDDDNLDVTADTTNYNSILTMDEYKPKIGNHEIWRSDLNISIQGNYNIEEEKVEFNYFNLDTYNTIHLTKNWLFTYATGINLMDMKIKSQSLKFYRQLHCWEFMFTWWPDGYSKGFQLSINVKHPDLKDIRVRSSSSNRNFNSN